MHKHRKQADGSVRASDNWQKGMSLFVYMKSICRHYMDVRLWHRGRKTIDIEEALCALIFNAKGYLFEILKEKSLELYYHAPEENLKLEKRE